MYVYIHYILGKLKQERKQSDNITISIKYRVKCVKGEIIHFSLIIITNLNKDIIARNFIHQMNGLHNIQSKNSCKCRQH